jgi:hypothetical protein
MAAQLFIGISTLIRPVVGLGILHILAFGHVSLFVFVCKAFPSRAFLNKYLLRDFFLGS